ncbi:coniferyl aldehyde dehydrogenase [Pseudomonas akapageensis]|uniref:coniferyl aldehyde dehydrogenase n=1 Tax=Pseudomonas akapageensis TaxID=2609961 RepID=UPI00140B6B75|nr:coniferyl aldehyde dehydrogenase [Pseudomonas akapageensis]
MSSSQPFDEEVTIARMRDVLKRQQAAFIAEGPPSTALRIDRIDRVIHLLLEHQQQLCKALATDFSWRSHDHSLMSDVLLPVAGLNYARKHLRRWMKPERRRPEMGAGWLGARAEIHFQPLGSIGIMAPWNFPVAIALGPLAEVFAAGNRAMILLSEFTPATSALLIELLRAAFDETEVAAYVGGAKIGAAFSSLPLDHIVFTGSPRVGRLVMAAAAENLTPLTLELGGKSPTIIGRGAELTNAARRIWGGKGISAGQACIAPDYVLVHEDDRERLLTCMQVELQRMFPTLRGNQDYTAIATPAQYERLQRYLRDAEALGVRCIEINPAQEDLSAVRKIAPTLLVDPPEQALVMQEEIFGPLLPIVGYRTVDEAIAYVNARPRPLALYYFGNDRGEARRVLAHTRSGGVCINEVMQHIFQSDLPFGGCGNSGFGRYRGGDGFKAFSLQRAVFTPAWFDVMGLLRPPYGNLFRRVMGFLLKPAAKKQQRSRA